MTFDDTAAGRAHRADPSAHTCGCFVALCRDPFDDGLYHHYRLYHPERLPKLYNSRLRWARAGLGPKPIEAPSRA